MKLKEYLGHYLDEIQFATQQIEKHFPGQMPDSIAWELDFIERCVSILNERVERLDAKLAIKS